MAVLALGSLVVPLAALVLALLLAGGAPAAPVPGLPDAGPLTAWGLPVVTLLARVAAVLTIGSLLVGAVLVPPQAGALRARRSGH